MTGLLKELSRFTNRKRRRSQYEAVFVKEIYDKADTQCKLEGLGCGTKILDYCSGPPGNVTIGEAKAWMCGHDGNAVSTANEQLYQGVLTYMFRNPTHTVRLMRVDLGFNAAVPGLYERAVELAEFWATFRPPTRRLAPIPLEAAVYGLSFEGSGRELKLVGFSHQPVHTVRG